MAQCPKCKEEMPPLSKICPICGYTDTSIDAYEGNDSISMIFDDMQRCVREIKSFSMPSIFDGMKCWSFLSYPILFLLAFILAAISESTIAWFLTLVFLVMSIISMIQKLKGNSSTERYKTLINSLHAEYESSKQKLLLKYGASRDIKQATANLDSDLDNTLNSRKLSARRVGLFGIIISVILLALATVIVVDIAKSAIQEQQQQTEEVETY